MLDEARSVVDYLKDKYGPWAWMGQRAHDACGINDILPLDFIISCDYGSDIPHYFREEDVYSVEKKHRVRKDWSNEDLNYSLKGSLGRDIFGRLNSYKKRVNLICYRSVRRLENGFNGRLLRKPRIFAMPQNLKRRFDNKAFLHRSLPKLSISRIPGKVCKTGKTTFEDLRKELSLPFVIQFPYGSSGHYTFIIRTEGQYRDILSLYPDSTVLIRKYVDGFSLNVNGLIISSEAGPRTICSAPSVQITGVPECSNSPAAFCGNDYTAARNLGKDIIGQVRTQVDIVGRWMAESGFRGIFGMDLVVRNGKTYPVEINPRFQNSTSLYTTLSHLSRSRKGTLFLLHIAEMLQAKDKVMRKYIKEFPERNLMRPLSGCQLIIHNPLKRNVLTGELRAGVYRLKDQGVKFVTEGASLSVCRGKEDFLVTCAVPETGTIIEPNAVICKVQSLGNILDPENKRKLTENAKKVVKNIYDRLRLREAGKVEVVGTR